MDIVRTSASKQPTTSNVTSNPTVDNITNEDSNNKVSYFRQNEDFTVKGRPTLQGKLDISKEFTVTYNADNKEGLKEFTGTIDAKGKAYGNGVKKYNDGSEYVGEFQNHLKHGNGTYINQYGVRFTGAWKEDEIIYENVTITYPENNSSNLKQFVGSIDQEGKPLNGTMTYADESTYKGKFHDGLRHDDGGVLINPKKEKFTGTWKEDLPQLDSNFTIEYPPENKLGLKEFVGKISNQLQPHKGTMQYKDNSTYSGDFGNNGCRTGAGVYTYKHKGKEIKRVSKFWNKNKVNGQYNIISQKNFKATITPSTGKHAKDTIIEYEPCNNSNSDIFIKSMDGWWQYPKITKMCFNGEINDLFEPISGTATYQSNSEDLNGCTYKGTFKLCNIDTGTLIYPNGNQFEFEKGELKKIQYVDGGLAELNSQNSRWEYTHDIIVKVKLRNGHLKDTHKKIKFNLDDIPSAENKSIKFCNMADYMLTVWIFQDGGKIYGSLNECYIHGTGTFIHPCGTLVKTNWNKSDVLPNTPAEIKYIDGSTYRGTIDNDFKADGIGILTNSEGMVTHAGSFKNGNQQPQ